MKFQNILLLAASVAFAFAQVSDVEDENAANAVENLDAGEASVADEIPMEENNAEAVENADADGEASVADEIPMEEANGEDAEDAEDAEKVDEKKR